MMVVVLRMVGEVGGGADGGDTSSSAGLDAGSASLGNSSAVGAFVVTTPLLGSSGIQQQELEVKI